MKHVSDLLGRLVDRKHIRVQVEAAQTVAVANEWLNELMPDTRKADVCAMSLHGGMLVVACTTSASAQFVIDRAQEGIDFICRKMPQTTVARIQTRLVSEIQSHEF